MKLLLNEHEARELIDSTPKRPYRKNILVNDVSVKIKTEVVCARTNRVIKNNPFRKNLTYDIGLNAMARSSVGTPSSLACGPASLARVCRIGDSTSPVKIASGAITFTQAAFTVTASSGFFTAQMVGAILKYGAAGSGGVEYYITAFTSVTQVTVDTSATVGATAGVVWMVQQSSMGNLLFTSSTYQTNANDNQSTVVGNVVTHQRTFIFPVQGSPYNVNEVGYSSQSAGTQVCGRIILPSTDVVGTSNFYRVIILITITYTPSAPTAVGNIGVNWNTAGTAMMESMSVMTVDNPSGSLNATGLNMASLDASSNYAGNLGNTSGGMYLIARIGATYAQQPSVANGLPLSWGTLGTNYLGVDPNPLRQWTYLAASVGKMKLVFIGNVATTGQTCYGIGISPNFNSNNANRDKPCFDILFTTPQVLPNGSWLPSIEFTQTYSRTLVN